MLAPDAYRQKFRNLVKESGQTHVAFAREKENAFNRWLTSMKVDEYDKLKQLVLVEEFKSGVSAEVRVHLDEPKVTDLKSATVLEYDYALTHKKSHKSYPVRSQWWQTPR